MTFSVCSSDDKLLKVTKTTNCYSSAEEGEDDGGGDRTDHPFAMYGSQNEEKQFGAKRTFNVRAAKEVDPSSLRSSISNFFKTYLFINFTRMIAHSCSKVLILSINS